MRKFIDLVESAQQWPERIAGWDLAQHAEGWHHTPEDFEDGDIAHNIEAFGEYDLRRVPLSELNLDLFSSDDYLIRQYAQQPAESAPPIIVDLGEGRWGRGWVIDGNHRAKAALARGEHDILAYVGDHATYDPTRGQQDDDEWEPDGSDYGFVRESEGDAFEKYMHGDCDIFALAAHRKTGWSLVAEMDSQGNYSHVLLQHPSGKLFDFSGLRPRLDDKALSEYYGEPRSYLDIDSAWLLQRLPARQRKNLSGRMAEAERHV